MKRVDVCVITRIICESHSNYKKGCHYKRLGTRAFTLTERSIFVMENKSQGELDFETVS